MGAGRFPPALSCLIVKLEGLIDYLTGSNPFAPRHGARACKGVAVNMRILMAFHSGTRAADPPAYTDSFHQEAASLCSCSSSMIASPSPYSATVRRNMNILYA